MINRLYSKLISLDLLKRAWHLARNDSRTDFMYDPYRHNDYAFRLEDNLKGLLLKIEGGTYRSQPLLEIDVPKSTLTVRPGTVIEIEDRIVLFAILCLIAPILDKNLPPAVYSYRLKDKVVKENLFKDTEILDFPFLKRTTIQKRLQIFEPWYGQWPKFLEESQYVFENDGYNFLSLADITAYFENIHLEILRDILLRYLPKEQKIINMLINIYEDWTLETPDGRCLGRGLPQGNSVSSFLGNIYLLPVDEVFIKFNKTHDVRYFRYMDDVKIFSKNEATARQVIFEMNRVLRSLHLNMQGSKTDILRNGEIRQEIEDDRLSRVNNCIKSFQGKKISGADHKFYVSQLTAEYRKLKTRKYALKDKDFRLFRRLITAFTLLQHGKLVNRVLLEMQRNPDYRLMASSVRYFRVLPNKRIITSKLVDFLKSPENLFAQQEALIAMSLRYMRDYPSELANYMKEIRKSKRKHWYVRSQAYLFLAQVPLSARLLARIKEEYDREINLEVKRAMVGLLCQLEGDQMKDFVRRVSFDPNSKIGRLGRMLLDFYTNSNAAREEINNLFHNYDEIRLMDGLYKLEVIKHHSDPMIKDMQRRSLKAVKRRIRRPILKSRIEKIIEYLDRE